MNATPAELLAWIKSHVKAGADLRLDSREVRPGDVYVALAGDTRHGASFIQAAVASGAKAVLCETVQSDAAECSDAASAGVPVRIVSGLRTLLGELADQWYGQPSAALTVIAVTGTNGKTSCVQWIVQALRAAGQAAGAIGTLGATLPDGAHLPGTLTTPDVLSMHRILAHMRDAGARYVALEASSIGLVQGRLDGVRVALAAFTNVSRDHLDFHGDMTQYEAAKARLFSWPGLQATLLNVDDAAGARLHARLPDAATYGLADPAATTVGARDLMPNVDGQSFTLVLPSGEAHIVTRVLGEHNVYNMLLVAGVLHQLGWSFAQVGQALGGLSAVDGRLQVVTPVGPVRSQQVPLVVVDYAHTPDALQRALAALAPVAAARGGKLICLFGCGGDRDPGKRPEMARVAAAGADAVVVTSDNPRSESPDAIIAQIVAGLPGSVRRVVHPERTTAILLSIWQADAADVVLLAGKGHETYQDISGRREPLDDREWARLAMVLPHTTVSTDTRQLSEGELFLALQGPSFDGHDYLAQARQAGACVAVVAHRMDDALPQIVLGPTGLALLRMASAWRLQFDIPVIAVAGSNGKTTTKEMVSAILAQWQGADRRLATVGNLNNEIGVPLTLLRLRAHHAVAVIEMGMNHPGEIAVLAHAAAADVALITNAQREHQEFMQSVEAVARENGEVFTHLAGAGRAPQRWPGLYEATGVSGSLEATAVTGTAVFPADETYAGIWKQMCGAARAIGFGLDAACDVYADEIVSDDRGTQCRVHTPCGSASLSLAVAGRHNLRNALAALAATLAAGVPLSTCVAGLAAFSAVGGRMHAQRLDDGTVLIDDTYNANPDSVRAAIDVLATLPAPRVLVLGDMGEVGENGPAMHTEVGAYAQQCGVDGLLTLGQASRAAAQAFGQPAQSFESVDEVVAALVRARPASVLVKGSRFMRMERVVKGLMGNQHAA